MSGLKPTIFEHYGSKYTLQNRNVNLKSKQSLDNNIDYCMESHEKHSISEVCKHKCNVLCFYLDNRIYEKTKDILKNTKYIHSSNLYPFLNESLPAPIHNNSDRDSV